MKTQHSLNLKKKGKVLKSFLSKGQVLKLEVKTDPSIMGRMIGEKYVCKNQHSEVEQSNADFQSADFLSVEFFFFQFLILEKQVLPEQKKNFFYLDPPPRDFRYCYYQIQYIKYL